MKELVFISCQPADLQFVWQVDVQLQNFKKFGYDKQAHVLVFLKHSIMNQPLPQQWLNLADKYPDTQFFFYKDGDNIEEKFIKNFKYIPLLRPWCLKQHFKHHPELKDKAIFYHDSDIVFTKKLDFSPFLQDDVHYLSYTGSEDRGDNYLNYDYFIKKAQEVDPTKKTAYEEADPLSKFAASIGITTEIIKANNQQTGGAQYLLKNIDAKFWADVFDGCLFIKTAMHNYNQRYFPGDTWQQRENKGFQAWCADMWSLLWNLWKRGGKTECPKEMDFAWSTDPIEKWDRVYIYHDAGATKDNNAFWKNKLEYVNNLKTPFQDDLSWVSRKLCSYNYTLEILNTK